MSESRNERDPVELLADEFAARCRSGESPSVAEYAEEYPEHAGSIEELFPAVAMMEQLRLEESAKHRAVCRRAEFPAVPQHLGDFEIIGEIGRGGMGIVYEAQQRSLSRRVAVKVLPKHALLLDKDLKRFQREAQTAAQLHHTNIVPVYGVGDCDGLHYYVMPLVRGVGLDEVIRKLRQTESSSTPTDLQAGVPRLLADRWRTAARIGVQAANALAYAHAQGTLHRDIKPSNLLIDADGVLSVADFGLARAVDSSGVSRSGEVVGTLRYMAPEQVRGTADVRSDIYALGLTLYELLTLRPAFDETDRRGCLSGTIGSPEPAPPRKISPAIPRDLETIVLKCLAAEPSERYQTAAALAADLQRYVEDRPIHARRASLIERTWRWCRRNPALAGVSALAAVLVVAVAVTALTGYLKTRRAYSEASAALKRAETTSHLSLSVLEDIYLQLSPDRVWISSTSDPGGQACACIGLRSGDALMSTAGRAAIPVQASRETAAVLENLLVFYDRLAEQDTGDCNVLLQSAIASRRVGDIRQRLGQLDQAEREYAKGVEKLRALRHSVATRPEIDERVATELARGHNEIGNVHSAQLQSELAYDCHREAFSVLESFKQTGEASGDYRYELARTLYFLSSKRPRTMGNSDKGGSAERPTPGWLLQEGTDEHRQKAIGILEELSRENPDAPDYRFLLALCHRPSGVSPAEARGSTNVQGLHEAIAILEELTSHYPGVPDYRYELTATYAWVPVGLFPWQGRTRADAEAGQSLRKALDESEWLVTHNPTIPAYACCRALILAKLGMVSWNARRLAEAEDFFRTALETLGTVVAEFPDLPSHNRVFLEFVRLRLAQVCYEQSRAPTGAGGHQPTGGLPVGSSAGDLNALGEARQLLAKCIENLTQLTKRPELASDRLAWTSLPVAYIALRHVLEELGQSEEAE